MKLRLGSSLAALLLLFLMAATGKAAQSAAATLSGQVLDPSGAAVPNASVTVTGAPGAVKAASTNEDGRFAIGGLAPGQYTVRAGAPGFSLFEQTLAVTAGPSRPLLIRLKLSVEKQQVTVSDTAHVDVDPSHNVGALVLKGQDLEALSDDPDDLAADLQALAGPAAGPDGGQIYIDGFTGGQLPSKASIREVRINQNPFSAEYDKLGFGRIEIFTKPGTDKLHGQAFFNFGDSLFNSRNPFSPDKPAYQSKFFGGNLSGALSKKASFFFDADRRAVEETSVVSALTLDPSLNVTPFSQAVLNPITRTSVSPRLDYQLTTNNTLTARYTFMQLSNLNSGIGQFSLPSRGYDVDNRQQTVQLTETAVLNPAAVNETRFQYIRSRNQQTGRSSDPTVTVLDAFTGGGSNVGLSFTDEDRIELQNSTSLTRGKHLARFGGRLRGVRQAENAMQNYNGAFTFTSLNAYRTTLEGLAQGLTAGEIRARGGGASQFTLTSGNPAASINQFDMGLFAQDDWRLRPNFTLSLGLRYETQNHIGDRKDIAPRIGFAWGLGGKQPKTVIRGGFGIFYDRFTEDLTLQAIHLNGTLQQQFVIPFPDFYPNVPSADALESARVLSAIRRVDSALVAPYIAQSAISVERQLPRNISIGLTYTNSRGVHTLRSRNINAPLPGAYDPLDPGNAVRPYGDIGNIYLFESTGIFKQNQLISNVNARINSKLTLFGFYVFNKAESNTDGASTFPANQYDLSSEWGRAGFDVRHRTFIGGSVVGPLGLRFSPFITAASGRPFNILSGLDLNGDSLFNDRPAFATDLSRPSVVITPYGAFDTRPLPGMATIPRNYGSGPGQFTVNLRLSRTFGFGGEKAASSRGPSDFGPPPPPSGGRGGGGEGGGRGGPVFGGGARGGFRGIFGDAGTTKRYNLTFGIMARNLLNRVNYAPPIGNLLSPLFGTSNAIAGGFGQTDTANRRVELQMRFTF